MNAGQAVYMVVMLVAAAVVIGGVIAVLIAGRESTENRPRKER